VNGRYSSQFGSYANQAQAEFANFDPLDDDEGHIDASPEAAVAVPANGNTGPADLAGRGAEPASDVIVVPFPAQRAATVAKAQDPLIERLTTALTAADQNDEGPTIGVELRRETATFTVPVSQASLPAALAKLAVAVERHENEIAPKQEESAETIQLKDQSEGGQMLIEHHSRAPESAEFEPPLILRRMVE
jgi:hypothetical protein